MFSDILLDLAVEKIRIDFGDLSATLFQIMIIQNGSSIYEINKIIPYIDYDALRNTLFKLFNHNIIFFKKYNQDKNNLILSLKNVKMYGSLHTPINRIRFPRYLSIMEREYGHIVRQIIKKFMEYGQINITKIVNMLSRNDIKKYKEIEDCMIDIARDQYIEKLIFPGFLFKKNLYNKDILSNLNNHFKPVAFNTKLHRWKISYLKLISIIKLDITFSVAEEYFCEKFKSISRCCLSKNSGNNLKIIYLDWFSLDSIKDYAEENTYGDFLDELFLIQLIENFSIDRFILEIKKCSCKFRTENILFNLKKKIIENFINNQFGQKFFRIFKTLSAKSEIDEIKISEECIIDKKLIRKFLYQMYRMSFIFLEEKNKYINLILPKNLISWKLNLTAFFDRYLFEVYKSIYNLLLRIEDLNLLIKKKNFFNYNHIDLKENNLNNLHILRVGIFRLEGLLLILEK